MAHTEQEPLLKPQAQQVTNDVALEQPVAEWDQPLLACCGNGDMQGCATFSLVHVLPCVAFGHNLKRAFQKSVLLHALIYFMLFLFSAHMFLGANNMQAAMCPHGPRDEVSLAVHLEDKYSMEDRPHRKLLHGHHEHNATHYEHDDDREEREESHHKHEDHDDHEEHDDEFEHGFVEHEGHHHEHEEHDGPHGHHHHPHPPKPTPWEDLTPECQVAIVGKHVILVWMVLCFFAGVAYCAYRRTQLREKFGIAGSRFGDLCTWLWCGPCALCQETRTLWTNNVEDGIWRGPAQLPTTMPPQPQFVTGTPAKQIEY